MKGVPAARPRRNDVVEDEVGEDGVAFNVTSTTDEPQWIDTGTAILLGLYGTTAMLIIRDKQSAAYMAGAAATVAGAFTYFKTYFIN